MRKHTRVSKEAHFDKIYNKYGKIKSLKINNQKSKHSFLHTNESKQLSSKF